MSEPFNISIPAGTKVIQCSRFNQAGARVSCDNKNQLRNDYAGEIQYDSAKGTAVFKSPDFISCIEPKQLSCIVEFTLPKSSLVALGASNRNLSDLISTSTPATSSPQAETSQSLELYQIPPSEEPPLSGYILPISIGAGILLFIGLACVVRDRWSPFSRSSNSAKQPSSRQATRPAQKQLNQFPSAPAPVNDSNKQIAFLTQQLQIVKSKISSLEDEIISLSQRLQDFEGKSSSLKSGQISPSLNTVNTTLFPSPPPAYLSVELIKKAVLSCDYNIISAHPHYFLTETPQSQQGLEDVKRFMIDGDQSQSSSRTQSEFIAITCNSETYLIPNIVPNAADPSRTLKRHADKNNIYRNGQGAVFLNLDQLAIVQKNGDRFDLVSPGQIA